VLPQSGLTATATRVPIEFRRLPWIKRLAVDYAFEYARLAEFFAGSPTDPSAWRAAIARAQRYPRQRDALSDVLEAQQRKRGAPAAALAATARLRDPRSIAIVTGQQAGLFGGPLFTLLKALTAIRLAERIEAEFGVPTVAVFWIDAEDHDWNEVKACGVLGRNLNLIEIALGQLPGAGEGPVADVRLDDSIGAAIEALGAQLPATEFSPALLDTIRAAYQPGVTMVDAFGRLLDATLGSRGLIVFDAADPGAKPLAAPIFAREVEQAGATPRLAAEAGAALVARGYHAQVSPTLDYLALFHLDGVRTGISVRDAPALVERVRAHASEFSPNVLLRPLVQDTLFPTASYVAGPNELAYLAQLRGIYEAFGVPMPLMYQRATATIVDSNTMRFFARHELPLDALRAQDEGALNELLEAQIPPAVALAHEEAAHVIEKRMDALAQAVAQLDTTLEGAVRSTIGRMQDDLKKLHAKIIQAIKRKDDTLRRQFRHAQAQAFPGGQPQERAVGFVYFLNRYGGGLVDRLGEDLPLDQGTHWVITI
jgi:bacillithiol biosynthesis cysteine-adding enzyme BshC